MREGEDTIKTDKIEQIVEEDMRARSIAYRNSDMQKRSDSRVFDSQR